MSRTMGALALALVLAGCASTTSSDGPQGVRKTEKTGTFEARHAFEIPVPEGTGKVQAWFPLPATNDDAQEISNLQITVTPAGIKHEKTKDTQGNEFLYVEADKPAAGKIEVVTTFTCKRWEVAADLDPAKTRPHTEAEKLELKQYLEPGVNDAPTPDIIKMADETAGTEKNPILVSRKLYDKVLAHVEYHVKDPNPDATKKMQASGKGCADYTFKQCTGNCTDFHSLYAAMSRHLGIPTRSVYGSFFKGPLAGKDDKDQSYHCWVEFHAPGVGWVPLDVAVADVFTADFQANEHSTPRAVLTTANGYSGPDAKMVDYYFGNLEERRVTWHYGRDLVMTPKQAGNPLPWNPVGYAELDGKPIGKVNGADGKPLKVSRKLTFRDAAK